MLFTPQFRGGAGFHSVRAVCCLRFFAVLGVVKLRITHPELRGLIRAWGATR